MRSSILTCESLCSSGELPDNSVVHMRDQRNTKKGYVLRLNAIRGQNVPIFFFKGPFGFYLIRGI